MRRLDPQPGERIDRRRTVPFTWNGRPLTGLGGDTIASALLANDVRIVSRSMKYHRPRSYMTMDYWDPNGLLQVGDEPNVRSAHRRLEPDMAVSAQNVWPSVDRDLKAANRLVGRFLSAGFYYKTFMRPRRLWPLYERVLATYAPGGRVDTNAEPDRYDKRFAHPDVVVAGGGPAGMAAAVAAAEAGCSVMLVEHEHQLGGHLLWGSDGDRQQAEALAGRVTALDIEVLVDSTVTGRYDDNWVSIVQRSHPSVAERLIKARAKTLVVAPGLIERPYVFDGNDRPGVMLSGAARRLINLYALQPGQRAVVYTANDDGDDAARELERIGVEIVRLVDARADEDIVAARGPIGAVEAVELGDGHRVEADLVVVAAGWTAPTSLLNMAGDRPRYDPTTARFHPVQPAENVLATGGVVGDGSIDDLIEHGMATGALAAARAEAVSHRLRATTAWAAPLADPEPEWAEDTRPSLERWPHPERFQASSDGIVDFSEDVGSKDLRAAAAEGFDSVELLKRFTTATMGPSQGKLSTVNTVAVLAGARGESIDQVGTTVWRPPFAPITLGALAGRIHEPMRHSPLQEWHEANGAKPLVAGAWIRPEHYGDPAAEVVNTRSNAGIIDVSPLGKFDVQGRDAVRLLDLLYINSFVNLRPGAVRYGVMCADDGVVLDDGVTARLGQNHFYLTTTSSGAATVGEWAENWLQTEHPTWEVHLTAVSDAFAAINLAGPNSRRVLQRLAPEAELSNEAFGYMQVRSATVAGVENCRLLRIGFTGELSYELHVPAGYGLDVWTQLLEVGRDLGVAPFGVEAQRIMRLEKGHFIVGQDSDGLTTAADLGLGALIKAEKDDFVGKPELVAERFDATGEERHRLVALQPEASQIVPDEACLLLRPETGEIVGRITSSRRSPTLGRSICLGRLAADLAAPGTRVDIRLVDGGTLPVRVQPNQAHLDPEGTRARG